MSLRRSFASSTRRWKRVQDRIERTRETYPGRRTDDRLRGRREAGLISNHLLAGFRRCGTCGGNLIATVRSGRGGVKKYWICTTAVGRPALDGLQQAAEDFDLNAWQAEIQELLAHSGLP